MEDPSNPAPIQGRTLEKDRERMRHRFFEELDEGFARLRADPAAWADWQAELKSMEGTLMDGLEDDPWEE